MPELDYFKKELIRILTEQEKEIRKSRGYPVGTIREWKGKKFKKVGEGKWVKVYESVSRGAKLSIAAVKRKIDHAQSAEELLQIVLMNKQRFIGNDGFLLPIVKELNEYIDRKNRPLEESKETEKQGSRSETVKAFQKLADVLGKGAVETVIHPEIGEILVESGTTGKHGYGLKHIIEQRYLNDKLTIDEISMLVPLVVDAAQTGKINKENSKTIEVEKNGIICIIAKQKFGKDEKWVLTGFENWDKKEEATDAIQTGIARYSYTPEYSYFRKQAGAVIASLSKNISQSGEKSSGKGLEERKELIKERKKAAVAKDPDAGIPTAKTIEEAEKIAEKFCSPKIMASTFKGKAQYKGISLENANKINQALFEVYNTLNLEKISGIRSVSPTSALGKKAFKGGADAVFSYNPVENGIFINKDVIKNVTTFEDYVKRSEEAWNTVMSNIEKLKGAQKELALRYRNAGRSLVEGKTIEGMFTHELGHHVQWTLLDASTNNIVGKNMSKYAPKISGYANHSKSEYLAESFSAYMKGERENLDPLFVRFIDEKRAIKKKDDIRKIRTKEKEEKSSGKGIEERKKEYKAQYKKFCEKLKLSASDQNIEDSVTRMLSKIEKKDGELLEILKNSSNKMSRMMFFGETGINLEGKSSREAEEIVKKYLGKEKADEYEAKLREQIEEEKKQEEERKESEFHALSHSIDASEENKALFGEYLRELPPKSRKKTAQYFSKRWRYEVSGRDKAGSIVQFLSDKIESSQFKELKENVSWREYGKNGELTEKKDPFRLTFLDGSFTVLKKTEGQFAKWLLEKKSAGKR